VVAPDEMNAGACFPNLVQGRQDGVEALHAKMGIVEPEIEDISEQDEVVCPAGQLEKFDEFGHAMLFGFIGGQMEMGIGHNDGRGFIQIIHAA
jgi:hypothetical protein